MADRTGQHLGNYRLVSLLGSGGFAEVYLGIHVHLGSQAAIKLLHTNLALAGDVERFRAEAQTIVSLNHPNIVRLLDFGVEAGTPYLVMDYAPNGSLRQRLTADTPLPPAMILPYLMQVAEALQYAHERKLVHRDVKPENILLGRNQEVLLTDFGIATVAQNNSRQRTEGVAGTAAYMAPEQLQGKPRPSSDLYALGVVVYEWLCGERPFQGGPLEVVSQHVLTPPPPLREKVPGIPAAIEQVVLTALAKDPGERFRNVRAFANAFLQACREAGMVYVISSQPVLLEPPTNVPPLLPQTGQEAVTGAPARSAAPPGGPVDQAGDWIYSVTTHITPQRPPPVSTTPAAPGLVPQAGPARSSAEAHPFPPALTPPASTGERAPAAGGQVLPLPSQPTLDAATRLPPAASHPPFGAGAGMPPQGGVASSPSAAATASRAPVPSPLTAPPSGSASDPAAAGPLPAHRPFRWLLVGLLVLLLAGTSGILGVVLVNNLGHQSPTGPGSTAGKIVVGTVTFSDADPNDFSHPASTLVAALTSLRQPARGVTFFAWLCDSGAPTCTLLGPVAVEQDGSAVVRASRAGNWLEEPDPRQPTTSLTFEITAEPTPASGSPGSPSGQVVYSGRLPGSVLVHVRHELTHFPKQGILQGNTTPLIPGLGMDAVLLQQLSAQLQQYQIAGDLPDMQETAAYLLNLLGGKTAAQDGDHDGDTDNDIAPGDDGVGLGSTAVVSHLTQGCDTPLMNYLPLAMVHACNSAFASASPALERLFDAIQAAGTNIAGWIAQIEPIAQQVLSANQASDVTQGEANTLVSEADMVLNGQMGDVQNQDGARQILAYVEQMATITVSAM